MLERDPAILRPGRHAYNAIGTYGGNIIDADWHHPDGIDRDSFETLAPGINIENTAHYTSVTVLNDGTNGSPAVIRATGVDDLLDAINASSVVKAFTPPLPFPPAQDDTDLPITIQTDYSLAAGDSFVKIATTYVNTSGLAVATFFGDNNLLPGRRREPGVITPFGPLVCADPRLAKLAEAAPVTLAVRPEALRLELPARTGAGAPDLNRLAVEVRSVDFIGPTSRVWVVSPAAPDRPLLVKVTSRIGGIALRPGDRRELVWAAADGAAIPGVAARDCSPDDR